MRIELSWSCRLSLIAGFINIDRGYAVNTSYINNLTGMEYVSDAEYIDTAENHNISRAHQYSSLPVQNFSASLDRSYGQWC